MHVGVLIYHHVNELEAVAPVAVLATARRLLAGDQAENDPPQIEASTVARSRHSIQTSGGLTITPGWAFASAPRFDALVVPGGPGVERARRDPALRSYFETRVPEIGRLVSISAGALILGGFGLLRDQRVAAHADIHDRLAEFEIAEIAAGGVVRNERVWCAAGATDAASAAAALLAEHFGADIVGRVESFLAGAASDVG